MPKPKTRDAIIEALMGLAAERRWDEISLAAVAERASLPLAELRAQFDGRLAVLADYIRRIDEKVLKGIDSDLAEEAPRERLFDVLFARFEAHNPHKQALRNIGRAAFTDPLFALALNGLVTQSMAWMLAGADISASGRRGRLRAQGLALVWARVMRVYLDDDDPGLARTMAALDKRLREAERVALRLDWMDNIIARRHGVVRPRKASAENRDMPEGHPT